MEKLRDSIDFKNTDIATLFRKLLLPTVLGMIFSALFVITDGIFVGKGIGSDALAAVNIVAPLWLFSTGIGLMFGVGASVVASIHLSHGKVKVARINITQSIVISSLLLIGTSTLFCTFAPQIVSLLGGSERLMPFAVEYMRWFVPFSAFTALLNSGMFFLRLDGSPNYAMMCNVVAAILNIILDYLFIFPFGWGMFGAAVASAIGTTVGALMIIFYLMRRRCALRLYPVKLSKKSMLLTCRNVGYMCRLGSSAFLCEIAIACMMFVGNIVFIHYLKEDGVAAFSIACYFFPIIFMVYNAIAQSAQPIISYNYGLQESLRVRQTYRLALKTAITCGACFALVTMFCSPQIVGMFIDRSYPAYEIAVEGLPYYATGFIFFAVNVVSIGYFQSVERAKYATIITLLRGFILLTACFFGLPLLLGNRGIWLATPLAELLTTIFIFVIYIIRKRESKENCISLQHGNHDQEILQKV
ncbi:MATE family efflux transporter [Bacteroides sp.]|uniref:MATE family efflux transporter n=1 Tax=Bacteroides sp. TaxID=29523 RepID=UPI0026045708|nr:MATE family efflux transporter [Bacteroides sp.]